MMVKVKKKKQNKTKAEMYFKTMILGNLHKESTKIPIQGWGGGSGGGGGEDSSTRNMLAGGLY